MELSKRQQALVLHGQKVRGAEIARLLGVTPQAVSFWLKQDREAPKPVTESQVIAMVQAARTESAKVVPIRPDLTVTPPDVVPTADDLRTLALEGLRVSIQAGDPQTCMWVLERVDPDTFASPRDRKAMAELRKAAGDVQSARVVVTVAGARPRKREAG
jgi:hypothetical protein